MKIQFMSDLHLEMLEYNYDLPITDADLVILIGDIGTGLNGVRWAINQSELLEKEFLYIRGNHEYWGYQMLPLQMQMQLLTKGTRVDIMENQIYSSPKVNILCCTLWTDYMLYGHKARPDIMRMLENGFIDNLLINPPFKITANELLELHEESLEWIRESIQDSHGKKTIVATHHAPTIYGISPKYRFKDMISPAFASDLEEFIKETQPDYWLHGHTHFNHTMQIGKTKILTNQKGYPSEKYPNQGGLPGFDPAKILEI